MVGGQTEDVLGGFYRCRWSLPSSAGGQHTPPTILSAAEGFCCCVMTRTEQRVAASSRTSEISIQESLSVHNVHTPHSHLTGKTLGYLKITVINRHLFVPLDHIQITGYLTAWCLFIISAGSLKSDYTTGSTSRVAASSSSRGENPLRRTSLKDR